MKKGILLLFTFALLLTSSAVQANNLPAIDNDVTVENVVETDFQFGQLYVDQMIQTQSESMPERCPSPGPDMECEWDAQLKTCACWFVRTNPKKPNE